MGDKTTGMAVSPNGKYVTGANPSYSYYGINMVSFLYDTSTSTTEWLTSYDETDLGKGGEFSDVNDNGTLAGTFKNPEHLITVNDFDGARTAPVNEAAVWTDGKRTGLGFGDFDLKEFTYLEDGSFGKAVSNDGKTVVGFIGIGNATYNFPMMWKQGDDGKWTHTQLELPEGAVGAKAVDVSADGSVTVGTVWFKMSEKPAFWKDGKCTVINGTGEDEQYNGKQNVVSHISPNGRYISFMFQNTIGAIYDMETGTYKKIPTYGDGAGLGTDIAVDDNGNAAGSYGYGSIWFGEAPHERPFWYSYNDGRLIDFDYYMGIYAPGA